MERSRVRKTERVVRLLWTVMAFTLIAAGPLAEVPFVGSGSALAGEREESGQRPHGDDGRVGSEAGIDVRETVIVTLQNGADPQAAARALGVRPTYTYQHVFTGFAAKLPSSAISAAGRSRSVLKLTPDLPVSGSGESVPSGIKRIAAVRTTDASRTTRSISFDVDVAVLDSGVNKSKDLNVVGGTACVGTGINDLVGHGTHVAGTIAARDNRLGVVGVAPAARIWSVRVLNERNQGTASGFICGLDWVYAQRDVIDVVNMSLGGTGSIGDNCDSWAYRKAICEVVAAGIPVVASAGNAGAEMGTHVPAAFPETIAVAALADSDGKPGGLGRSDCMGYTDDTLAEFSNFGTGVDIAAPGTCVRSLGRQPGTIVTMYGTSMATPHVTGALARFKARQPRASTDTARDWLLSDTGSKPSGSSFGLSGPNGRLPSRVLYLGG